MFRPNSRPLPALIPERTLYLLELHVFIDADLRLFTLEQVIRYIWPLITYVPQLIRAKLVVAYKNIP
jgi:hypothetical protein